MLPRFIREAGVLRALAHPVRLAILAHLRRRPACVCHLTRALGRPQAYVSQQLAVLRGSGLIEGQREGAYVYYGLRDRGVLALVDLVGGLLGRAVVGALPPGGRVEGCECPRCRKDAVTTVGSRG
ncbi:MAG: winged helix-turn-helix transcriptional regulator [Armatimonadetes bacterium]|nr:winged helix-turn-helix transcriptional regulator [Armatimonadota bacterium]